MMNKAQMKMLALISRCIMKLATAMAIERKLQQVDRSIRYPASVMVECHYSERLGDLRFSIRHEKVRIFLDRA